MHSCCVQWQAHYPLIQRVEASAQDAANGTATQAGGPYRYLLQANTTGADVLIRPSLTMIVLARVTTIRTAKVLLNSIMFAQHKCCYDKSANVQASNLRSLQA